MYSLMRCLCAGDALAPLNGGRESRTKPPRGRTSDAAQPAPEPAAQASVQASLHPHSQRHCLAAHPSLYPKDQRHTHTRHVPTREEEDGRVSRMPPPNCTFCGGMILAAAPLVLFACLCVGGRGTGDERILVCHARDRATQCTPTAFHSNDLMV